MSTRQIIGVSNWSSLLTVVVVLTLLTSSGIIIHHCFDCAGGLYSATG